MPIITFIAPDASSRQVQVEAGTSVMEAAIRNNIGGILAECGGNAMCATCHVYIAEDALRLLPPISEEEDALLDSTASERRPNSRLSCQVRVTAELDGTVVALPDKQI